MSGGSFDSDDEITGINVTPLVDVMLVLLIIFMVTATYIVKPAIPIKLPESSSTDVNKKVKNVNISVDKNAKIYLDSKLVTPAELSNILNSKYSLENKQNKLIQALISADKETRHGEVIKVIDLVRKSGITEFAISVESESDKTVK